MPVTVQHDRDNILRIDLQGALQRIELQRCQDQLKTEMDRVGAVRLLFVLNGFDGWEADASWKDLFSDDGHGHRIERIAIVGLERWQSQAWTFALADLYRARVECFTEDAAIEARAWLAL